MEQGLDLEKNPEISNEELQDLPWVSIVLPTYNRAAEIKRSIQSILEQTYRRFELIIVDDGSMDDTEQVVQGFRDKRIKYFRMSENGGQSKARNFGMKKARYDYIAFQDSDDMWHPDKLELQMQAFFSAPQEVGFVYCKFRYDIEEVGQIILPEEKVPIERKNGMIYEQLLWENLVGMPALIIKKECLEKVGYLDETLKALEDYDFALRLAQYYQAVFIDQILLETAYSPTGVSSNALQALLASCILVQKHKKAYIEKGILMPRLERILKDAEKIGMTDKIVPLLEKIMRI